MGLDLGLWNKNLKARDLDFSAMIILILIIEKLCAAVNEIQPSEPSVHRVTL
jgi:hypothetical protein